MRLRTTPNMAAVAGKKVIKGSEVMTHSKFKRNKSTIVFKVLNNLLFKPFINSIPPITFSVHYRQVDFNE
jgi:hypothetical protein